MQFVSTRGKAEPVSFSVAMARGLAPDLGLYIPAEFPRFAAGKVTPASLPVVASQVLAPFFAGDGLVDALPAICSSAFSFPVPLVALEPPGGIHILELFHGPTAAFKDVGARFLAECFVRLDETPRTVLVATSGDTGGAVAAAFHRKPGIEVVILFPRDGVSAEQKQQLTCWGDNVSAFAVRGVFDDCQKMLKDVLGEDGSLGPRNLTTANSINIARLLPQMTYYAYAALQHGGKPTFVVPTGNVGNATAALWAMRLGFPIRGIVMATNANRTVPDYLQSGDWQPRPSQQTLANAMDVGDPSNMERVFALYPTAEDLRAHVRSVAVDDEIIRDVIRSGPQRFGRVFDPHTATAVHAAETMNIAEPVIISTAHPAKFAGVVAPLVDQPIEVPDSLARIRERPSHCTEIDPTVSALRDALG